MKVTCPLVPLSAFETAKSGGRTPQISINISGLNSPSVSTDEVFDVDVTDVDIKDSFKDAYDE